MADKIKKTAVVILYAALTLTFICYIAYYSAMLTWVLGFLHMFIVCGLSVLFGYLSSKAWKYFNKKTGIGKLPFGFGSFVPSFVMGFYLMLTDCCYSPEETGGMRFEPILGWMAVFITIVTAVVFIICTIEPKKEE